MSQIAEEIIRKVEQHEITIMTRRDLKLAAVLFKRWGGDIDNIRTAAAQIDFVPPADVERVVKEAERIKLETSKSTAEQAAITTTTAVKLSDRFIPASAPPVSSIPASGPHVSSPPIIYRVLHTSSIAERSAPPLPLVTATYSRGKESFVHPAPPAPPVPSISSPAPLFHLPPSTAMSVRPKTTGAIDDESVLLAGAYSDKTKNELIADSGYTEAQAERILELRKMLNEPLSSQPPLPTSSKVSPALSAQTSPVLKGISEKPSGDHKSTVESLTLAQQPAMSAEGIEHRVMTVSPTAQFVVTFTHVRTQATVLKCLMPANKSIQVIGSPISPDEVLGTQSKGWESLPQIALGSSKVPG